MDACKCRMVPGGTPYVWVCEFGWDLRMRLLLQSAAVAVAAMDAMKAASETERRAQASIHRVQRARTTGTVVLVGDERK